MIHNIIEIDYLLIDLINIIISYIILIQYKISIISCLYLLMLFFFNIIYSVDKQTMIIPDIPNFGILLLGIIITAYVIPWIKEKIGEYKYNNFIDFVSKCVRAADQYYEPEQWASKKAYVVGLVQNYAIKIGINLDENDIDAVIEGLVNILREG